MSTELLELDGDDPSQRSRRGALWVAGALLVLVGGTVIGIAVRHRPANDDLPYYLPSYQPSGTHTASAWSRDPRFGPQESGDSGSARRTYFGGAVGADGRLERWLDVTAGIVSFEGAEIDVAGTPAEFVRSQDGELRIRLAVDGCGDVELSAVGFDAAELVEVASSVWCDDGAPVVMPPSDQTELCRVDFTDAGSWAMDVEQDLGRSWFALSAHRHDCPLLAMTGIPGRNERLEQVNGRPTLLGWTNDRASASFRDGDLMVVVEAYFVDDETANPEAELRRIVEGLERVDATTWHEENAMFPLGSDHG